MIELLRGARQTGQVEIGQVETGQVEIGYTYFHCYLLSVQMGPQDVGVPSACSRLQSDASEGRA